MMDEISTPLNINLFTTQLITPLNDRMKHQLPQT